MDDFINNMRTLQELTNTFVEADVDNESASHRGEKWGLFNFFDDDEKFFYDNDNNYHESEQYQMWKHNKKVREQIERDDPKLVSLKIGYEEGYYGIYCPHDGWEAGGKRIGRMTHLKELAFFDTNLMKDYSTDYSIDGPQEEEEMKQFFRGIPCNRSIKKMSFYNCDTYSGELFTMLVPFLRKNNNFESLTAWVDDEDDIPFLSQALSKFDSLRELVLSLNCEDYELEGIFSELSRHKNFRSLRVGKSCRDTGYLGRDSCTALAALLKDPEIKLELLDLSGTSIEEESAHFLAEALAWNTSLKDLHLGEHSSMSGSGWDTVCTALQKTGSKVECLSLVRIAKDGKFPPQLANVLSKHKQLKKLDLSANSNWITTEEWKAIFTGLQTSKCMLVDLNLSRSTLHDDATSYLVKILSESSLKRLDLTANKEITRSGWELLFSAISNNRNSALGHLNLSQCDFNGELLISLANALSNNSTVRDLKLRHNKPQVKVTAAEWQAFSIRLLSNTNSGLEKLDLFETRVDEETMIGFATALAGNKNLKELLTSDCKFECKARVWAAFARVMCNTTSIMATYNSNHTLQKLYERQLHEKIFMLHQSVRLFMGFHSEMAESQAARLKIIKIHFPGGFAVKPFIDMDLNVLPHALSWISRDSSSEVNGHLYGFLRSVYGIPLLIDINGKDQNKRKRLD